MRHVLREAHFVKPDSLLVHIVQRGDGAGHFAVDWHVVALQAVAFKVLAPQLDAALGALAAHEVAEEADGVDVRSVGLRRKNEMKCQ